MSTQVQSITDQSRKDLSDGYKVMMGLAAWKHFEKNILSRIDEQATKDEDSVPLDELTTARIAECRGRRKTIEKIFSDVDYIVQGLK